MFARLFWVVASWSVGCVRFVTANELLGIWGSLQGIH